MKRYLFFALTAAIAAPALAQKTVLEGVVADSLTRTGEAYATVRVLNAKSAPVAAFLTDSAGRYRHTVTGRGRHTIVYSLIGKRTASRTVDLEAPTLALDTVFTQEISGELATATVVGERPLVKMEVDKMTYNLQDDADAKSSTVLDMLRKVPLVTVDGQDNILVNGNSNFKIYVDGKPNPMLNSNASLVLKNMPASYVKNIEVITNPGAKYDAEGTAGIINLVTQTAGGGGAAQKLDGYNAQIGLRVTNLNQGTNGFLNWQKGKFSLSANANYYRNTLDDITVALHRTQADATTVTSTLDKNIDVDQRNHYLSGGLSLSYEIDSLRLVTSHFNVSQYAQTNHQQGATLLAGGAYGATGMSYDERSKKRNEYTSFSAGADYQRHFAGHPNRVLTLSYLFSTDPKKDQDWVDFTSSGSSIYNLTDRFSDGNSRFTEHTAQLDYTTPLAANHTLSLGTKYIGRINSSDSKYYEDNGGSYTYIAAQSVDYKHFNDIAAGYAEYEGGFGKWKLKTGVRYEHTWQRVRYRLGNASDFHLDYGNLVPTASLSFSPSPYQNIGLSYNMRISRPSISSLNPYVDTSDPTAISYGNSDLAAEKLNSLALVYNLMAGKIMANLRLSYNFCNNAIEEYNFYRDNVLHTTYGNVAKNRDLSTSLFVNWNVSRGTRLMINSSFGYTDMRSDALDAHAHGWEGNLYANWQQDLPWELKLSLGAMWYSKRYTLQGYGSTFSGFHGSLTRKFMNDRLSVAFIGFSPFGKNIKQDTYISGRAFTQFTKVRVPVYVVGVELSYSLGNLKARTPKVKRGISNDDVKETKQQGTGAMGGIIPQ